MSIELKVGEWYETRNGERVKVLADARRDVSKPQDAHDCIAAFTRDGRVLSYYPEGNYRAPYYDDYYDDDNAVESNPSPEDIVKHLEGCTGWGWKKPKLEKWRDATPEDAIRQPHLTCRVRSTLSGEWIAGCSLVGYYVSGTVPQWIVNIAGVCGTHDYCQVLDE